ncbi:GNAT family N-acetyltransferase [Paenibacillus sp. RC67]|uniref:GNAT family N-acetyltransferase n=1 Tax=Paenibacillus sp. RC67 TaxID=3039392 RepID=UPI0024AE19CC|nr:GNAT family N-acetyltransferase [Paenibacillus sp. RC67]
MNVELQRVSYEEKGILRNLLEFYLYEISAYLDSLELNPYGQFEYRMLDHYWTDGTRHPFFIRSSGKIVGLVLVREWERAPDQSITWLMAEFFILRKYQKLGIGRAAAIQAFELFPGRWIVSQIESNAASRSFWHKIISEYTNGAFQSIQLGNQPAQQFEAKAK